jgi:hypothetical protein
MHIGIKNCRRVLIRGAAATAIVTASLGLQVAMTAPPSEPSTVITIDPARILDTRVPIGVPTAGAVGPNSSITLQVAGAGGVPADATGVIITLTATDATIETFITATPTGTPRATTSVLNPAGKSAIANTITIALGTGGSIDLYNLTGSVHLVADVSGYLVPANAPKLVTESVQLTAYGGSGLNGTRPPALFGCVDLAPNGATYVDIPLPNGATVTRVDYRWFDNDASGLYMYIREVNDLPDGTPIEATLGDNYVQSVGALGWGRSSLTPTGGHAVSNSVRYYLIASTFGVTSGSQQFFCGATVTYTRLIN